MVKQEILFGTWLTLLSTWLSISPVVVIASSSSERVCVGTDDHLGEECFDMKSESTQEVVGSICIDVKGSLFEITYKPDDPWIFDKGHIWIGAEIEDSPQNEQKLPIVSDFPIVSDTALVKVPLGDLPLDCAASAQDSIIQTGIVQGVLTDTTTFGNPQIRVFAAEHILSFQQTMTGKEFSFYFDFSLTCECYDMPSVSPTGAPTISDAPTMLVASGEAPPKEVQATTTTTTTPAPTIQVIAVAPPKESTPAPTTEPPSPAPSEYQMISVAPPKEKQFSPTAAPTSTPTVLAPTMPVTEAPSLVGAIEVTIGTSFTVHSTVPKEFDSSAMEQAFQYFIQGVMEQSYIKILGDKIAVEGDTVEDFNLRRHHRKLAVEMNLDTAEVYKFTIKTDCPLLGSDGGATMLAPGKDQENQMDGGLECRHAYARYSLLVAEDHVDSVQSVCDRFTDYTQNAFEKGNLQTAILTLDPSSTFVVQAGKVEFCLPVEATVIPEPELYPTPPPTPEPTPHVTENMFEFIDDDGDLQVGHIIFILLYFAGFLVVMYYLMKCYFGFLPNQNNESISLVDN